MFVYNNAVMYDISCSYVLFQLPMFDKSLQHFTSLTYHHPDHDSYVSNTIYHYYLNRFALNFAIHVQNDEEINCHRVVLLAMSERFRKMCEESDDGYLDVNINNLTMNTTKETVEHLMQLLYNGRADIHDDNVEAILTQSMNLQLHELLQHCIGFVKNTLTMSNIVRYYECAESLQCDPLITITLGYINKHYQQLLSKGKLAELQIGYFKSLLTYWRTDGADEHMKLEMILQWLAAHPDYNDGVELLNNIQFEELSNDCLQGIQHKFLLEQQKPEILDAFNIKYKQELERRQTQIARNVPVLSDEECQHKCHISLKFVLFTILLFLILCINLFFTLIDVIYSSGKTNPDVLIKTTENVHLTLEPDLMVNTTENVHMTPEYEYLCEYEYEDEFFYFG